MKLVLATGFTGGTGFAPFLVSLTDTLRLLDKCGIEAHFWSVQSAAYVDDMRNAHVAKFLASDATHLIFLDYDMQWTPGDLLRLVTADMPVVTGNYRVKNAWGRWVSREKRDADGHVVGIPRKDGDGHLVEAVQIAMGFTCIKRGVFEAMRDAAPDEWYTQGEGENELRCYDWFTRIREGRMHFGEDYSFCQRWRALGGQMWIEPNVTLHHWGLHGWRGNLHELWIEEANLREQFPPPVQRVAAE
jgi:hypothetical protein